MGNLRYLCVFLWLGGACEAVRAQIPAENTAGWVVLPVEEYQALREKAHPVKPGANAPPVDATVSRIDYDLRLDGAVATGKARIAIDVLRDGWVRVPIPRGLLVRAARLNGAGVALVPDPKQGQLSAVLPQKGRAALELDVAFTIASASGEQRLSLPAGNSGVTRAAIVPPGPDVDLSATGGYVAERTPAQWIAYAKGGEPLVLIWRRRVEEPRAELPLRMRGSLTQLFGLGEDASPVSAEVSLEVIQGAARQVKIAVPANVTINQVPGATVSDWDIQNDELVVNFLEPVERNVRFAIAGESRLPREGAIAVPMLKLLGVERDSGGVAVEVLGAGEINQASPAGLEPIDAAELGGAAASRQSPSMAAYRYRALGGVAPALNLTVARYTQQAVLTANVEEARYRALLTPDGKTLVEARYAVRNNQRNFLRITLPSGAEVWSAALEGQPVRPGEDAGSLLFPLAKERAGQEAALFPIEVVYLVRSSEWMDKGGVTLALPALDLPVSRTGVVVYFSPEFSLRVEPGIFRPAEYETASSDVLAGRVAGAPARTLPTLAVGPNQRLADSYRARARNTVGRRTPPIEVSFPALGPTLFLQGELTGEGAAPTITVSYKKGGSR